MYLQTCFKLKISNTLCTFWKNGQLSCLLVQQCEDKYVFAEQAYEVAGNKWVPVINTKDWQPKLFNLVKIWKTEIKIS